MPITVNVHAAKTQLSKLLEKVQAGEQFIIARAGKPVAILTAVPKQSGKTKPKRQPGFGEGLLSDAEIDALVDPALDKRIEQMLYSDRMPPNANSDR